MEKVRNYALLSDHEATSGFTQCLACASLLAPFTRTAAAFHPSYMLIFGAPPFPVIFLRYRSRPFLGVCCVALLEWAPKSHITIEDASGIPLPPVPFVIYDLYSTSLPSHQSRFKRRPTFDVSILSLTSLRSLLSLAHRKPDDGLGRSRHPGPTGRPLSRPRLRTEERQAQVIRRAVGIHTSFQERDRQHRYLLRPSYCRLQCSR